MKLYVGKNPRVDWVSLSPTDVDIIKSFGNGEVEEIVIDNVLHTVTIDKMVELIKVCASKLRQRGTIEIVMNDWYEICSRFVHSILYSSDISQLIAESQCGFAHSELIMLLTEANINITQVRHEILGYQTYVSGTKK